MTGRAPTARVLAAPLLTAFMVAGLATSTVPTAAAAADVTLGPLTIEQPWARASAGMARAGAAFMTITNDGAADRLIAAAADVSDVVELHTHIKDGDVMRMRKIDAIEITGGTATHLRPGGLHIMFIGLHAPLEKGETFPVSLTFETAGTIDITVTVQDVAAMAPAGAAPGAMH
ncbi:copper chaperone PCu(A)C [Roseospira visakhapatnamensis]|uniref:Copper chaperone PCu(A)C n=1 Tax=Roseospira visakhapatnamensis TaxID=390880 RepID=A0A7W6RAS4_9PROT|nr:copper chaperone PCu(A)C [Roseospira visakhapatnamensis]MBB4265059.1 hypothetical protein [Roseospira visakhapatnamensis]